MMASFESVNYSLRPSKVIQRQIIFDGIRMLKSQLNLKDMGYIGFGSVWFTDFVMAHKLLGINDMVSMEHDVTGHLRAIFNKPYATIDVQRGKSSALLKKLHKEGKFKAYPWVIWLDYDNPLDEPSLSDIEFIIEKFPENSVLLVTFDGRNDKYGYLAKNRLEKLEELFEELANELSVKDCTGNRMKSTMGKLTLDFMRSVTKRSFRSESFQPAFRVIYEDTVPMITVGGFLPSSEKVLEAKSIIRSKEWRCRPRKPIVAPLLTLREIITLQAMLPNVGNLSRKAVRRKKFDLKAKQIETFQEYYREYPTFAQIWI